MTVVSGKEVRRAIRNWREGQQWLEFLKLENVSFSLEERRKIRRESGDGEVGVALFIMPFISLLSVLWVKS